MRVVAAPAHRSPPGYRQPREETDRHRSPALVGFNFVATGRDGEFVRSLAAIGGDAFVEAVQFVGVDIYPNLLYGEDAPAYPAMAAGLVSARLSVNTVGAFRRLPLHLLEVGAPTPDEAVQARRLAAYLAAARHLSRPLRIAHLNWFDLWDADSASPDPFAHYGLLRSDFTRKPAYDRYREVVGGSRGT